MTLKNISSLYILGILRSEIRFSYRSAFLKLRFDLKFNFDLHQSLNQKK